MRKLLTFIAAVCCSMFVGVSTVQAALPSDDADIVIQGVQVEDTNLDDVFGDGGSISYDPIEHRLTLDNADITGQVVIDATANGGFDVKIKVKGFSRIEVDNLTALWYKGNSGSALIIEAESTEDRFVVRANSSSTSVRGILCASDYMLTEVFPLIVKDVDLTVYNNGAYSGYPAVSCDYYMFSNCKLDFFSNNDTWPLYTNDMPSNQVDHVTLIDQMGEVFGYPYTKAYPVWINGVQMSDGLPVDMTNGLHYISGWEMYSIESTISMIYYDPEKRELILDAGVVLNSEYGEAAIVINDTENPSDIITIRRGDTFKSDETKIVAKSSGQAAMKVLTPVVFDANGSSIRLEADAGPCVQLESELTFTNLNLEDESTAEFWLGSDNWQCFISNTNVGELYIDHVTMSLYGKKEVCVGLAYAMLMPGMKFAKEDDYEFKDGNLVEKGTTNVVKYDQVWLSICGWFFDAEARPAGTGTFVFKNESDVECSLPYLFTYDEQGSIEAKANDGWSFVKWDHAYTYDNPVDVYLSTSWKQSVKYTAQFSRNIESQETFYGIGMGRKIRAYYPGLRQVSYTEIGELPEVRLVELRLQYGLPALVYTNIHSNSYINRKWPS